VILSHSRRYIRVRIQQSWCEVVQEAICRRKTLCGNPKFKRRLRARISQIYFPAR